MELHGQWRVQTRMREGVWAREKNREAGAGIEPTHSAFAEPCLTTWLPRRNRSGPSERKKTEFVAGSAIGNATCAGRGAEREETFAGEAEEPAT